MSNDPFRGHLIWDSQAQSFVPFKGKKKEVSAPYVITDEIPPTEYMGSQDREFYTSKSKLAKRCKQDGYYQSGGELPKARPPRRRASREEIRDAAERAFYDLKYDRVPISEREKELCKQEERAYQEYLKRQR